MEQPREGPKKLNVFAQLDWISDDCMGAPLRADPSLSRLGGRKLNRWIGYTDYGIGMAGTGRG
jgi:hypothetical protein